METKDYSYIFNSIRFILRGEGGGTDEEKEGIRKGKPFTVLVGVFEFCF